MPHPPTEAEPASRAQAAKRKRRLGTISTAAPRRHPTPPETRTGQTTGNDTSSDNGAKTGSEPASVRLGYRRPKVVEAAAASGASAPKPAAATRGAVQHAVATALGLPEVCVEVKESSEPMGQATSGGDVTAVAVSVWRCDRDPRLTLTLTLTLTLPLTLTLNLTLTLTPGASGTSWRT